MLLTIAALIVNPQQVIALGGLMAEHDAYDVRCNIKFRGQRGAGPSQVMARPTARSRPLEDRLRPAIPVVEFAAMGVRKYKLPLRLSLPHLHQHRNGLARQGDNVRLGWNLLFSRPAARVLTPPRGDGP